MCCEVLPKSHQCFCWGTASFIVQWKNRLNSFSVCGLILFFFHFHLSGGKDNFSHNLLEPWEHWQPHGQSPGTSLSQSVPPASPLHRSLSSSPSPCPGAVPCAGLAYRLWVWWQISKKGRKQCSQICLCCDFNFFFYLLLMCWCLHNFVWPPLLFFCTLTFLSSSFFALCSTISWWWLLPIINSIPFVLGLVLLYPTPRRAIKFLLT